MPCKEVSNHFACQWNLNFPFFFMYPVTEKHEGDSMASEAPHTRDAGLLETVWSGGTGDEEETGKRSWRTAQIRWGADGGEFHIPAFIARL